MNQYDSSSSDNRSRCPKSRWLSISSVNLVTVINLAVSVCVSVSATVCVDKFSVRTYVSLYFYCLFLYVSVFLRVCSVSVSMCLHVCLYSCAWCLSAVCISSVCCLTVRRHVSVCAFPSLRLYMCLCVCLSFPVYINVQTSLFFSHAPLSD